MKKRVKKRPITLIEIMIVILLIGLVGGALAYNMRGGLQEGRKFKTEQAKNRVRDILEFEFANGNMTGDEMAQQWEQIVIKSPLGNKEITTDGWKRPFTVTFSPTTGFTVEQQTR